MRSLWWAVPRKLKSFPARQRRTKYPWDQWLDGSVWELRKGSDYDIDTLSLRALAGKAAKRAGTRVRTKLIRNNRGESLVIQAYKGRSGRRA